VTRERPLFPVSRTKGSLGPRHVAPATELGVLCQPRHGAAGVCARAGLPGAETLSWWEGSVGSGWGELIIALTTEKDCETFC